MLILFILIIWIPLLVVCGKRFGYARVWGCSVVGLAVLGMFFGLISCLKK